MGWQRRLLLTKANLAITAACPVVPEQRPTLSAAFSTHPRRKPISHPANFHRKRESFGGDFSFIPHRSQNYLMGLERWFSG